MTRFRAQTNFRRLINGRRRHRRIWNKAMVYFVMGLADSRTELKHLRATKLRLKREEPF